MSQKYVDPNALNENVIKTKQHVEAVRSALDSAKQNVIQFTTLPVPDATWNNKVVQYTGTTTQNYTKGYFYSCEVVPDTDPTEYRWTRQDVMKPIDADGTTVAYDQVTGMLSAIPATNSTKGIVQHGDGTEIGSDGQVNVVDRLVVTASLPTATSDLLNAVRLYVGASGTYELGGIYQCQETSTDVYEWVLISMADVDLSAYQKTFLGTSAEWNAKTTAQKIEYDEADITDDLGGGMVVSTVPAEGDHNPIESEAVWDILNDVNDNSDSIETIYNKLGSKNLLPNNAVTKTESGITFTVNSDGSVTANGTATTGISFVLKSAFLLRKGNYILTDGVKNQSYYATIKNGGTVIARGRNAGEFTLTDDATLLGEIWISSGAVLSNVTFYPMVRLAEVKDTTYAPHAMTNKELTDGLVYSTSETNTGKTWVDGKPIYRKVFNTTTPATANAHTDLISLPTNTQDVINMYGFVRKANYKLPLNMKVNDQDYVISATSNTYIRMAVGTEETSCPAYITLEYTKTTD